MLLFFIGILLIVSRSQSSLCSLLPQNNLLNKKSKIIINQFIEVTLRLRRRVCLFLQLCMKDVKDVAVERGNHGFAA